MQSILDRIEAVRLFKERMTADTYRMEPVKNRRQTTEPVKDSYPTKEAVEDSGDDSVTTTCGDDDARSYLNSMDDSWENSETHFLKKTEYYNVFNEDEDSGSDDDCDGPIMWF